MADWSHSIRRLRCVAPATGDPATGMGGWSWWGASVSLDPNQRLAQLRREVAAESTAAPDRVETDPAPTTPAATAPSGAMSAAPATDPTPRVAELEVPQASADDGATWDLRELLADTSLSTWVGIGLLALGGYLVLSWFVPGIDLIGSFILLAAGVVLLVQHLQRGAGAWALYAGAVLAGMGAARAIGDLLPGSPRGMTAMGVGLAFLAIAYLRHSQAGGYGWQGVVGVAALVLGGTQFLLGLLPGSPSVLDLVLPALLLIGGALLIARTQDRATHGD